MKRNAIWAAVILVGILCMWNYLAAKPAPEEKTSPRSKLLEIKEPSQEDFEHCAKRATDFFESMSADQTQMDIALHELFGTRELPSQLLGISRYMTRMKNEIEHAHPELISKKSHGENIIIFRYHYITNKGPLVFRFIFTRAVDENLEPLQWRCHNIACFETIEEAIPEL